MRYVFRLASAGIVVPCVLVVSSLLPSTANADYRCFTSVCGETWRNNFSSNCYGTPGYQCWQGTWSGTYSRGGVLRLVIEEHAEWLWWSGYYLVWQYKPGWNPKSYLSPDAVPGITTGGLNYNSGVDHRTWSHHKALDGKPGGNTSDGY